MSSEPAKTVNPIGSTLQARYQILERLGSEAEVTTYLAVDRQVPGNLQLKCIIHCYQTTLAVLGDLANKWEPAILSAQMLERDLERCDRWPTIYGYFVEDEAFYVVREFVQGVPLAQELLPAQPWTASRLVMLVVDLLEILQQIDDAQISSAPISIDRLLRRNVDRKLVSIDLPLTIGRSIDTNDVPPTQRDLRSIGEIAIAAASGLARTDLPLSDSQRAQWQNSAINIYHPELMAILERLAQIEPSKSHLATYPSVAAALQAVVKVMSQLLVHHQTPTNSQVEIAKHIRMLVDRGDGYYEIGDCQQAIEAYDRALTVKPQCVDALCGRGNARRYLGDYAGSWTDFDTAIAIGDRYGSAYVGRALAARFGQQSDETVTEDLKYGIQLLQQPRTAIEYVMRGTAKAQLTESSAAIDDYTSAIALNPRLVVAYNNRGNLRQFLGDLDGAIADFGIVLEIDDRSPIAYNNRAIVYTYLGKFTEAIADYTQALSLQPNFTSVYNNRANAYYHMGEYAAAIADYSQSIEFDPTFAIAYSNRGNIYRLQGDLETALRDYDRAISLDAKLVIAYYNRGICLRQLGQHDRAIADYTQTLALDAGYFHAYYHRGNARQYLGDKRGAIVDYTQTIRYDPNHLNAYYNRAVTRQEINELQGAIEDLECAIQLDPDFGLAYHQRGCVLASANEHQLAIADYQRAIDLQPNQPQTYYHRALSRYSLDDLVGAMADFSHLLKLDPHSAPAYYHRARVNFKLGDRSGAIVDYHRAANLYLDRGDSKTYQQILELLARLAPV